MIVNGGPSLKIVYKTTSVIKMIILKNDCFLNRLFRFRFLLSIKLTLGQARYHKQFGSDRFSCFDVCWIQTNKHTPRHANYI